MTYKLFSACNGSLATSQAFIASSPLKKIRRNKEKKKKDEARLPVTSALAAGFQDVRLFEAEFLPLLLLRI